MNVQKLAVLARELAHFLASVSHLSSVLHAEKRDPTPDELATFHTHDSRVMLAMTGTDPNSVTDQQADRDTEGTRVAPSLDGLNSTLNTMQGGTANKDPQP